jgi:hypothetical protein
MRGARLGAAPGLSSGVGGPQRVSLELEQVVGGRDQAPFGAGGRQSSAFEASIRRFALI